MKSLITFHDSFSYKSLGSMKRLLKARLNTCYTIILARCTSKSVRKERRKLNRISMSSWCSETGHFTSVYIQSGFVRALCPASGLATRVTWPQMKYFTELINNMKHMIFCFLCQLLLGM